MNDIEILQEMLIPDAQVPLHQGKGKPYVQLKDAQAKTIVEIKGLPHVSLVIRAEEFEDSLTLFKGLKRERKRADFVIVSNDERGKWIICIETQAGSSKNRGHVEAQLKGAQCLISYCKCIGRSFWQSEEFLGDYQYRFVSMVNVNSNKETRETRSYSPHIQSKGKLHDSPGAFLKIYRSPSLHFRKLLFEMA